MNNNDYTPGSGIGLLSRALTAIRDGEKLSDEYYAAVLTEPEPYQVSGLEVETGYISFYARTIKSVDNQIKGTPHDLITPPKNQVDLDQDYLNIARSHTKFYGSIFDGAGISIGTIVRVKFNSKTIMGRKQLLTEEGFLVGVVDSRSIVAQLNNLSISKVGTNSGGALSAMLNNMSNARPMRNIAAPNRTKKATYLGKEILNGFLTSEQIISVDEYEGEGNIVESYVSRNDRHGRPVKLLRDVMPNYIKLCELYYKNYSKQRENIVINDSYRSFERQVEMRNDPKYGAGAATPGTSDHGWGLALDINGTAVDSRGKEIGQGLGRVAGYRLRFTQSPLYKFLKSIEGQTNFINPFSVSSSYPESWHFETKGNLSISGEYAPIPGSQQDNETPAQENETTPTTEGIEPPEGQ